MCDVEARLVAWLDHELPEGEAAELERHIETCGDCRQRAEAYARASTAFHAYCDVVSGREMSRRDLRPRRALLGAAALAAAVALALLGLQARTRIARSHVTVTQASGARVPLTVAVTVPVAPNEPISAEGSSGRRMRTRKVIGSRGRQNADLFPIGPAVEITIPADAVLPPGAAPPGEDFLVDLSIAPDGSAQGIRVVPQLTGLERRVTRP